MPGGRNKSIPRNPQSGTGTTDNSGGNVEEEASSAMLSEGEGELTTAKAIISLTNKIAEMKDELKQELASLKVDMNQKLQNIAMDVRNQGTRLTEAEQRVSNLETVNSDLRSALRHCLVQQKSLLNQVTGLEGRSRRNNIRIYGIGEGSEKNDMASFIYNFLKRELSIGDDVELQIQRAHRALGPRPKNSQTSRSILVNFQRYDIKDKVLKMAWSKKITHEGKIVSFSHDMPTEIYNKLKEYKEIKKILKNAKVRFQTPYPARMKIHWDDGVRMYNSATEVAAEMRRRGYSVEPPRATAEVDWDQILTDGPHWDRMGGAHSDRVRERLLPFYRDQE